MRLISRIFAILVLIGGIGLLAGGLMLAARGGSFYYLVAGVGYVMAAIGVWSGWRSGVWLLLAIAVLTVPWALYDGGTFYWALFPRLFVPFAAAAVGLLLFPARRAWGMRATGAVVLAGVAGFFGLAFLPHGAVVPPAGTPYRPAPASTAPADWSAYGRTAMGTRYAPFTGIDRDNVRDLKLAWVYRYGALADPPIYTADQNTPLQIGDLVYSCSPTGKIAALDADTGKPRWTFDSNTRSPIWNRCRGLGFYRLADATPDAAGNLLCRERIIHTTTEATLIELDAKTGQLCPGFGAGGVVDLKPGMGDVKPGFYFQTSAPLVARNLIVIGGWVFDNQHRGEPSGVIRAFDAVTGELRWAWDLGNPAITKLPPEGETYTRGTPNMWTTAAYDDKLGLVYLPLGNETPDYFGMGRLPQSEKYASSLVALDVETGRERWHFQTAHHDIWDYDLPSQPALVDLPDGKGGVVPAVLQTTKQGQLFLLNRATGTPLARVEERPVPQRGQVPEERLAPTQPMSVGMPTIGAVHLTEGKMWGMTMFDQLYCRIAFHGLRYDGLYTPVGTDKAIENPGNLGGLNWGSVSYDPVNHIAYLNDIRIPSVYYLIPRADFDKKMAARMNDASKGGHEPVSAQEGTPYAVVNTMWMSPLGVPCAEPPFGTVTAVDLASRKVLWSVPGGTTGKMGPLGLPFAKLPVGMPTYAGTVTTAGGLVFFAGSQDWYLRAYDAETGKELWKAALPVGSSATPMTYVSPATGRQYVVVSASGAAMSPKTGDYVMAFALPDKTPEKGAPARR